MALRPPTDRLRVLIKGVIGPSGRFFTRDRADEIALLLREAEKHVLEGK